MDAQTLRFPSETERVLDTLDDILLGQTDAPRMALACLLAGGHLLIEDVPGVGKTTLALSLSGILGLAYQRIQFTADLLPSDVVGVTVYRHETEQFEFRPGPVFSQVVLADELNRAGAKTQSALLEAMEEAQVTVDGKTHLLPQPFFVIATLNPIEQVGTFALPESQLDRFLMQISLGYPDERGERMLLTAPSRRGVIEALTPALGPVRVQALQQQVRAVTTTPPLVDYILALVRTSRSVPYIRHGLSPRAGLALRRAAQAWAFLSGHEGVTPEDVQRVFVSVAGHRLVSAEGKGIEAAERLLRDVAIP